MPISSGALNWPVSHHRKPEETEAEPEGNGVVSRGTTSTGIWKVELTDRDDYEAWRDVYDKQVAKRMKARKKKKLRLEKRKAAETARDDVNLILRRRRLCRCVLLTSCLTVLFMLILMGLGALYVNFLSEDTLGPPVIFDRQCTGYWRHHFLGYSGTYPNKTVYYVCCYLPNVNDSYRMAALQRGFVWPDGFVVPKAACKSPGGKCEDFETQGKFPPGTPPCSAAPEDITKLVTTAFMILISILLK